MTRASDARGTGKGADPNDGPGPDQARPGRPDAGNGRGGAGRAAAARPDNGRHSTGHGETGRPDRLDPPRSAQSRGDVDRAAPGRPEPGRPGFDGPGFDGSSFDDPGFAGQSPGYGPTDPARGDTGRAAPGRPDPARPDSGRLDFGRGDTTRPPPGRPGTDRSAQRGGSSPEAPDAWGPSPRWPVVNRADTARADTARPDTARPDTGRADTARSDTGRAGAGASEKERAGSGRAGYPDTKWEAKARAAPAQPSEPARASEPTPAASGPADSGRSMSGLFGSAPASGTTDRSGSNDRSDTADRSVPDRGVGMSGAAGGPTGDRAAGDPAGESSRPAERPATSASIGRPGSADAGEGGRGGRDDSPSGTAAAAGSGAAARGGADTPGPRGIGPARPAAPSAAASPALPAGGSARGRAPLPGPPPSMRPLGPPLPPGPRYSSAAPRRRMLSGAERGKLTMLAVVLTLGGALLSYLVAAVLPSTYAARTTIQYNIAGENTGDFLKTDRNLTTQVVLLTSRSVLQPVADSNGINVDDLTKQVSASILSSSDIIQLQVNSSSPDTAVSLANGIAKQYLTVANNGGGRGYLESQLAGVRKQQSSSPYGTTAADTAALATRAAALQAQLDQMNLTQNMSSVLTPAYALSQPVSPNQSLAGFAGGLSGLVIALMTVVVLTRRWTRP